MAEAIGIVASILQIIDSVDKLSDLWRSLKHAPRDLNDCVHDIEHTAKLLKRFKQLAGAASLDDATLSEITFNFERVMVALHEVYAALEKTSKTHKCWGALKIVLKRNEIKSGKRKLKCVQSLLWSAQLNLTLALLLSQQSLIKQSHEIVTFVVQSTAQHPRACTDGFMASSACGDEDLSLKDQGTRRLAKLTSRHSLQSTRSVTIRFPPWLTRRCFDLMCDHDMSSGSFRWKTYNVIPGESEAFRAVILGNVGDLQSMFAARKVTPCDQNEYGETLLVEAFKQRQVDVARFLLDNGADLGSTRSSMIIADTIWYWQKTRLSSTINSLPLFLAKLTQLWEVFARLVDGDEDVLCDAKQWLEQHELPGLWIDWLPKCGRTTSLNLQSVPRPIRAAFALGVSQFDDYKQLLGDDLSTREILNHFRGSCVNHVYLLSHIARHCKIDWMQWATVVREIFKFEKAYGSVNCWNAVISPIGMIINDVQRTREHSSLLTSSCTYPAACNDMLHDWIQYLKDARIVLAHYGHREWQVISLRSWSYGGWRYVGLSYGPEVADWKIHMVPDGLEYEMAGDFWQWTEHPDLFFVPRMPGMYMDDPQDAEAIPWIEEDFDIRRKLKQQRRKAWQDRQR